VVANVAPAGDPTIKHRSFLVVPRLAAVTSPVITFILPPMYRFCFTPMPPEPIMAPVEVVVAAAVEVTLITSNAEVAELPTPANS
jgi:hypothetical protein